MSGFVTSQVIDLMQDNQTLSRRVDMLASALNEALEELERVRGLLLYRAEQCQACPHYRVAA
jgi:hypothetical protein